VLGNGHWKFGPRNSSAAKQVQEMNYLYLHIAREHERGRDHRIEEMGDATYLPAPALGARN